MAKKRISILIIQDSQDYNLTAYKFKDKKPYVMNL